MLFGGFLFRRFRAKYVKYLTIKCAGLPYAAIENSYYRDAPHWCGADCRRKVDDVGTHAELMERNGLYAAMFREQAKWYKDL